eukprot:m.180675 g.180675  ORF g.180675 m.180675 type:complete len:62 (-) comp15374_c0_seq57:1049-1234(-)
MHSLQPCVSQARTPSLRLPPRMAFSPTLSSPPAQHCCIASHTPQIRLRDGHECSSASAYSS